ncbi:MAG: repair protein RecN [Thermomicrobiales bacterium]|jgi:DNA repair protein RecN (Recombination protein N)|nr:repair protein RecN [Thermomicrobiales bacterium]
MLVELAIRNFAIIEAVQIPFGPGLNVLSGETGAGKSILIDALGAVLGDRVSTDMVRTGAASASIDATFDLNCVAHRDGLSQVLDELQIEASDGLLILSREIQAGGRSSARLNGRPTTVSILAQIGSLLVDIHGQSEHLSLLKPAAQLQLLDRFAQSVPLREELSRKLDELRATQSALERSRSGARERMQRVDLLRYQIEEINRAGLQPEEEEALVAERARLANADRLALDAAAAYAALSGSDDLDAAGAAIPALRQAASMFESIAATDPATRGISERATELLYLAEDLGMEVRSYRDSIDADPARLTVVEERLAEIRQLQRKYGTSIADILEHARVAEEELERLTGSEVDTDTLAAREDALSREVGKLAAKLSEKRSAVAESLAGDVERSIARLNMGAAEFAVSLDQVEDPGGVPGRGRDGAERRYLVDASGMDRVSFLIAPNPGEGLKPLSKIASGGETARLMLALKSILSEADQTPTLVFDEIDVGVGGRSGQVVGETLWSLTTNHQVIVITHLPQIAAFGDVHFQIAKSERDGRVVSTINALDDSTRQQELAAMLDGMPVTESSLRSAEEMLERAATSKQDRDRGPGRRE